jgi:DNA-binding response OmpR family regulator
LDWHTPGIMGIDVLKSVRILHDDRLPALFLTAENSETSLVQALTHGADDYIVKPFSIAEVRARVDAILRRAYPSLYGRRPFRVGRYFVDPHRKLITLDGKPVALTEKEFQLAWLLFSNAGRTVSRDHLYSQAWGRSLAVETRTIDSHICRVRTKLKIQPENDVRLMAVYRQGYRLDLLSSDDSRGDIPYVPTGSFSD